MNEQQNDPPSLSRTVDLQAHPRAAPMVVEAPTALVYSHSLIGTSLGNTLAGRMGVGLRIGGYQWVLTVDEARDQVALQEGVSVAAAAAFTARTEATS